MQPTDLIRTLTGAPIGALVALFLTIPLQAQDRVQKLSESAAWKNLLYYSRRMLTHESSLIDSADFFLSKTGDVDPAAELQAFVKALAEEPRLDRDEAEQIACRFPARTLWVLEHFPELKKPKVACPKFLSWLNVSQAQGVTLIFSSYYINSPSSMMGHSFLRLRRGKKDGSPLLDKAVNFAAAPTTENPLFYTFMGLSGSFPGYFSLTPYYSKVQEYANAESRDLWEYDLNFTAEETQRMLFSLWEVAPHRIDYYFFDENCSAILMYLLQNARPGLELSPHLGLAFVHPSDTLRALLEEPGLVSGIGFRPSNRSRYEALRGELNAAEKADLKRIFEMQPDEAAVVLKAHPEARSAHIIDAAIAYIEFDERLYGSVQPVKHKAIYLLLLKLRAGLDTPPIRHFATPEREQAHIGHRGQRVGAGLGHWDKKLGFALEYRPGQHDVSSPAIGYPPELSIELGRTRVLWREEQKVLLQHMELFRIQSFNPSRSGTFPWSWHLGFGFQDYEARELSFDGGMRQAQMLYNRDSFVYLGFDGALKRREDEALGCWGGSGGVRLGLGRKLAQVTHLSSLQCRSIDGEASSEKLLQSDWRWAAQEQLEVFLSLRYADETDALSYELGFYHYYY